MSDSSPEQHIITITCVGEAPAKAGASSFVPRDAYQLAGAGILPLTDPGSSADRADTEHQHIHQHSVQRYLARVRLVSTSAEPACIEEDEETRQEQPEDVRGCR